MKAVSNLSIRDFLLLALVAGIALTGPISSHAHASEAKKGDGKGEEKASSLLSMPRLRAPVAQSAIPHVDEAVVRKPSSQTGARALGPLQLEPASSKAPHQGALGQYPRN